MTVIGRYPCCDGPLMLDEGDEPPWPKMLFALCEHCGERTVHRLSKIHSMSWTEAEFPDWDKITSVTTGGPVPRDEIRWVELVDVDGASDG